MKEAWKPVRGDTIYVSVHIKQKKNNLFMLPTKNTLKLYIGKITHALNAWLYKILNNTRINTLILLYTRVEHHCLMIEKYFVTLLHNKLLFFRLQYLI